MELHIYAAKQHFKPFCCIAAIFLNRPPRPFGDRPTGRMGMAGRNGPPFVIANREEEFGDGTLNSLAVRTDTHACVARRAVIVRQCREAPPCNPVGRLVSFRPSVLPRKTRAKSCFVATRTLHSLCAIKPSDGRVGKPRRAYRDRPTLVQCRICEKSSALPNSFTNILELILRRSVKLLSLRIS